MRELGQGAERPRPQPFLVSLTNKRRVALDPALELTVFPSLLAYTFWDAAVRRGDHTLVASLSYLTPVLSTAFSCVYLGVTAHWTLWVACGLVVGGAAVCRRSVRQPEASRPDGLQDEHDGQDTQDTIENR